MSTPSAAPGPVVLEGVEATGARKRWTLTLYPDGLRGEREDGAARLHVLRAEAPRVLQFADNVLLRAAVVFRKPARTTLKLDRAGFEELQRWLGHDTLLRLALSQRLPWALPIGALFLLGSLPLAPDPGSGVTGHAADPVSAVLGAALIVQALLSRRWPHPVFFLLDSLWFAVLATQTIYGILAGQSLFWLLIVALQVQLVFSGIQQWRRFSRGRAAA